MTDKQIVNLDALEVATSPAANGRAKVIDMVRGANSQVMDYRETVRDYRQRILETYDPFEWLKPKGRRFATPLLEAWVTQPDAANMLRDGIRFIAFETYRGIPTTYGDLVTKEASNRPEEQYLRDAALGTIPRAPSGTPVRFASSGFEGGVKIPNFLYRLGVKVTGDDIRFDRLGKIRQIARMLGLAASMTEESEFYAGITTTANYTRNSTTNDNDIGANQQSLAFSAVNLDTALQIIGTAKDRRSGQYLGYRADTVIAGPLMEYALKQFFMSRDLQRIGAGADAAGEARGFGTFNPYYGLINRIVISPWFGTSYGWALCDSQVPYSYVWQTVDPWQVLQETMNETSEAWLINNELRYVISGYFGHGFVDDRAWFLSTTTTAPAGS